MRIITPRIIPLLVMIFIALIVMVLLGNAQILQGDLPTSRLSDNASALPEHRSIVKPCTSVSSLIRLADSLQASYRGNIPGMEATNPRFQSEIKLDSKNPASDVSFQMTDGTKSKYLRCEGGFLRVYSPFALIENMSWLLVITLEQFFSLAPDERIPAILLLFAIILVLIGLIMTLRKSRQS